MKRIYEQIKENYTIRRIVKGLKRILFGVLLNFKYKKNYESNIDIEEAYNTLKKIRSDGIIKKNITKTFINENIDLSIIVPAYNVSELINECIDSITNQKTKYKYEIILINDGSTDNTLSKINRYKDTDNIRIVCQSNKGRSITRNIGLDLCCGKYVMFVDADDILIENAIEKMLSVAYDYDSDIVEGQYKRFYDKEELLEKRKDKNKLSMYSYKNNPDFILKEECTGFISGKIFKRELWNNIRFVQGLEFEDTIVKYIMLRISEKYTKINDYVYGYRLNFNSVTFNVNNSYIGLDSLWIIIRLNEMCSMLEIEHDETLYKLVLEQLGKLLYYRTINFDLEMHKMMLIISRGILVSMNNVRPRKLSFWLDRIEKSILEVNVESWKQYSKIG